jgi:hypothetical protein
VTLFVCRLCIKFVVELPICSNTSTKQAIIFLIDIDNSLRNQALCGGEPWHISVWALYCKSYYYFSRLQQGCSSSRWLSHYATSRKVVGLFPDEVIGFSGWPNPSGRTMALGSTQPLTEMSTRNPPGGKRLPAHKSDNLTAICEPIV